MLNEKRATFVTTQDPIIPESLGVFLICIIFLLGILKNVRKHDKERTKFYFDKLPKSVEEIPSHYHFSRWMPTIVEGIWVFLLIRQGGIHALQKIREKCGIIFNTAMLTKRVIVVQDPELLQKILASSSFHVLNKPRIIYDFFAVDSLQNGLPIIEPNLWFSHRKMAARCFSYQTLTAYLNTINIQASRLDTLCPKNCAKITGASILNLVSSITISIIAEVMVGWDSQSATKSETLHHHVEQVKQILRYRTIHRPENILFSAIWWLNPKRQEYNKHVAAVRGMIFEDVTRCLEKVEQNQKLEINPDKPCPSLVEEMLRKNASVNEVRDEVFTFIIVGHDTVTCAVYFSLQLLAENPACLSGCQKEVDALFQSKSDNHLSMDDLSQLKYLERCIMECLRLAPPGPIIFRELSAPFQADNLNFKKGSIFLISPWLVHRHPSYYPEPEKFDPDRWLPDNVSQRPACAFLTFSYGPRNCIGYKFALMEMKVILAGILRSFDVTTTDKMTDVKILFDATLAPERDFNITLSRRKHL